MQKTNKGLLVVFEGLDRAGKSTHINELVYHLIFDRDLSIATLRFPSRKGELGPVIDDFLNNNRALSSRQAHLLMSLDRWNNEQDITNRMNKDVLVCDRYRYSGAAYSMANGLPKEWCEMTDEGLPEPDLIIYMNVNPETAAKRKGYGSERYEKVEFQSKVKECFEEVFIGVRAPVVVIDSEDDFEQNQIRIREEVVRLLNI
jgi:dTMP kinase